MELDLRAVEGNARRSDTESLLDRVTVYRQGMEPAALRVMAAELAGRGVTPGDIAEHERRRQEVALFREDGSAVRCDFCDKPAVARNREWYRLGNRLVRLVPLFPIRVARCDSHLNGPRYPG